MHVLISHYSFETFGGAERVGLHIARGVARQPQVKSVTIATRKAPGAAAMKEVFGPEIPPHLSFHEIPYKQSGGGMLVGVARFHRDIKTLAKDFDFCISTYNEQDFGKPSLQYVHHPLFADRAILRKYKIIGRESIVDKVRLLEPAFNLLLNQISKGTRRGRISNQTVTNSAFMHGVLKECGYTHTHVLYPGLIDENVRFGSDIEKKDQLCAIGRISSDKFIHELLYHFAEVRKVMPRFKLLICGIAVDKDYLLEAERIIHENKLPASILTDVNRNELIRILQESRFYINAKPFEHFGIATVEAMMCGTIPLLHRSGGSIELSSDPLQLYATGTELAQHLLALNQNKDKQQEIVNNGLARRDIFTVDAFHSRLDKILNEFIYRAFQL